ncbi:2-hydroxyacid dehydrogenase [Pectinatus frisingensis]|uniref:2-hydroxyacid dehydrogenase n=1 Tax=Pectinatus frisingensis TaxID=865 RepID=UPI002EDA5B33
MNIKEPVTVIVVGDVFVSIDNMKKSLERLQIPIKNVKSVFWGTDSKDDFQKNISIIEKNGPESVPYPKELEKMICDADILFTHFCPIPRNIIEKGKKLKLIGTCRGGLEHIDVAAATENNIPVVHVIRNAEPVADFTLGLILAETRNIARAHHEIENGNWQKEYPNSKFTTSLRELTVGLIGLGNVGKLLARKLINLGVNVIGYDEYVTDQSLSKSGIQIQMVSLEEVLKADVVSVHLRLTQSTRKFINAERINEMTAHTYFINTSRSGVVDESALTAALLNHRIAGAALDVFNQEPLPQDSPFLQMDNVTLTPHIAGDTVDAIPKSPNLLTEEISKFIYHGKSDMVVNSNKLK